MKIAGIIGWPLKHTLSPVMHKAAFSACGIDASFVKLPTPPSTNQIADRLSTLRGKEWLGVCVTIPHKESVMPFLDYIDHDALHTGAVNFIVNRNGKLFGYNTDIIGFLDGLRQESVFKPAGQEVLVIGAGGASRAVVFALRKLRNVSVTVANRTITRANTLSEQLSTTEFPIKPVELYSSQLYEVSSKARLIVNASSMGMAGSGMDDLLPVPADTISSSAICYDLVYTPLKTKFLEVAHQAGATCISGLSMLIYQGSAGFKLLTDHEPPVKLMAEAVKSALN